MRVSARLPTNDAPAAQASNIYADTLRWGWGGRSIIGHAKRTPINKTLPQCSSPCLSYLRVRVQYNSVLFFARARSRGLVTNRSRPSVSGRSRLGKVDAPTLEFRQLRSHSDQSFVNCDSHLRHSRCARNGNVSTVTSPKRSPKLAAWRYRAIPNLLARGRCEMRDCGIRDRGRVRKR